MVFKNTDPYNHVYPRIFLFQHGFMKKLSAVTNLTGLTHFLSESIYSKCPGRSLYSDQ